MPPLRGAKYKQGAPKSRADGRDPESIQKVSPDVILKRRLRTDRQSRQDRLGQAFGDCEAIRLFHDAKARRAGKVAEHWAMIRRIVTEADQREAERMQGGRPRKHGPGILISPRKQP